MAVLFYGVPGGKLDGVQAAFLDHFAQHDDCGATPERIDGFRERLQSAGVEHSFYTYAGTRHWFFEEDRTNAYSPEAALAGSAPAGAPRAWSTGCSFLVQCAGSTGPARGDKGVDVVSSGQAP